MVWGLWCKVYGVEFRVRVSGTWGFSLKSLGFTSDTLTMTRHHTLLVVHPTSYTPNYKAEVGCPGVIPCFIPTIVNAATAATPEVAA